MANFSRTKKGANPNSLANLKPGQSPGRGLSLGEPRDKPVTIKVTSTAKATLKSSECPFKVAGWGSLSAFVEAAARGEVQVPGTGSPSD